MRVLEEGVSRGGWDEGTRGVSSVVTGPQARGTVGLNPPWRESLRGGGKGGEYGREVPSTATTPESKSLDSDGGRWGESERRGRRTRLPPVPDFHYKGFYQGYDGGEGVVVSPRDPSSESSTEGLDGDPELGHYPLPTREPITRDGRGPVSTESTTSVLSRRIRRVSLLPVPFTRPTRAFQVRVDGRVPCRTPLHGVLAHCPGTVFSSLRPATPRAYRRVRLKTPCLGLGLT